MNNIVTITFPDEGMARLFLAWLGDGGGYDPFYDVAADDAGMYTTFEREGNADLSCRVQITGRVVDDDDPEMHGIFPE